MKTLEFKLSLSKGKQNFIDIWLSTLTQVWNRGLALLEWKQYHDRLQKCLAVEDAWGFVTTPTAIAVRLEGKDWVYYSNIAADFRIDRSKGREIEGNLETRPVVNLVKPHWLEPPLIDGYNAIALRKPFARKRYPELGEIPTLYVNDFIGLVLGPAWDSYLKGKRKRPRYKRKQRSEQVQTIPSESFRAHCKLDGDRVQLPGLGWLTVKGLNKRLSQHLLDLSRQLANDPESAMALPAIAKKLEAGKTIEEAIAYYSIPGSFNICKKASGYYLQITANLPEREYSPRRGIVGLSLGANPVAVASDHEEKDLCPIRISDAEKQLNKLQRQSSKEKGRKFPMVPGSKNWQKHQNRIAKLHEKVAQRRLKHQHWRSTHLADIYEEVIVTDLELESLILAPNPIVSEEGDRYLPNGATEKARVNKAFSNAATGQFRTLIETKMGDRPVVAVDPKKAKELLGDRQGRKAIASAIVETRTGVQSGNLTPVELASEPTLNQEADTARSDQASPELEGRILQTELSKTQAPSAVNFVPAEIPAKSPRKRSSKRPKHRNVLANREKLMLPES